MNEEDLERVMAFVTQSWPGLDEPTQAAWRSHISHLDAKAARVALGRLRASGVPTQPPTLQRLMASLPRASLATPAGGPPPTSSTPLEGHVGRRLPSGSLVERQGLRRPAGWQGQKDESFRPWWSMSADEKARVLSYLETSMHTEGDFDPEWAGTFEEWVAKDKEWIDGHPDKTALPWLKKVLAARKRRRTEMTELKE